MKKVKLNKRMGLGLLILALVLGIAACGTHRGPHHMDQAKMMKRITRKLDLNEMQQGKLQVVLENASTFKAGMLANHTELRGSLNENFRAAQLDVDVLNTQFDEIESEFSAFRKAMISDYAEFHASLDDSQREKLASKFEKMSERH
ncbi:MAG: periplasmic heavy metal sensor [Candidatus Marinimicrobia bacterium]|nr:periplasmic heavy metal sensor [FCB group bacterium]MBL7024431.1 periplasmic heavy metal sensor [Candidatus Neomarinimicrobiota bacterium]